MEPQILPAEVTDLPALVALLEACDLPPEGLAEHLHTAVVAKDAGRVVGSAALELYGSAALLRSVAVAPEARAHGLGQALVASVARLAYAHGVEQLVLLTISAPNYFARLGFHRIERTQVPPAVLDSVQFASVCPTSALVLAAPLNATSPFFQPTKENHTMTNQPLIELETTGGCCGDSCCGTSAQSTSTTPDSVKAEVRLHYAQAITAQRSCCSSAGATELQLYGAETLNSLPDDVVTTSFGCGNSLSLARLVPGETALDLGSGGGLEVLLASRQVGPEGYVYGLDMTDEMLNTARRNAEKAGASNVEFIKGEIEDIPLPEQSVDVILSNCVINLSPDKGQSLQEAFRVLKPGGRLAVSDIVIDGTLEGLPVAEEQLRSALSWVGCIAGALTKDEYQHLLSEAGFTEIAVEIKHRYTVEDIRELGRDALDSFEPAVLEEVVGRFTSSAITAYRPAESAA